MSLEFVLELLILVLNVLSAGAALVSANLWP